MRVLYEDNHLLVVLKPAGVPTQPDKTGDVSLMDQAKSYLAEKYEKKGNVFLGLVHRLDRPTAGVVVLARTSKGASRLSEQFRAGTIEKHYIALVSGEIPEEGALKHFLAQGPQNKMNTFSQAGKDRQEARLSYRRLPRAHPDFPGCSFADVRLETGRKHQIRAQFSAMGHPIVGDRKYGCRVPLKAGRIALAAYSIAFQHPTKDEKIVVNAEVPEFWPKASL